MCEERRVKRHVDARVGGEVHRPEHELRDARKGCRRGSVEQAGRGFDERDDRKVGWEGGNGPRGGFGNQHGGGP
jgi:hypothetical protein